MTPTKPITPKVEPANDTVTEATAKAPSEATAKAPSEATAKAPSEPVKVANDAVTKAQTEHDEALRAYEQAWQEKDAAYDRLNRARATLRDVLRVEAGLEP